MSKFRSIVILLSLVSLFFVSSCEKTRDDPCDDTVQPELAVTVLTTVHILNLNDEPIVNEPIRYEVYKIPCGADSDGLTIYNVETGPDGTWTSPSVSYNLRNSNDKVGVNAVAPDLENFFEQNYAYEEYSYSEFSNMSTKEVHLYIYATVEEK